MASYFDLDRNGQVYIASFCAYLQQPMISEFNFFKVNTNIITLNIADYVRNCLANKPELLKSLEREFKQEQYWRTRVANARAERAKQIEELKAKQFTPKALLKKFKLEEEEEIARISK